MTKTTTPATYPRVIHVAHNGQRLIKLVDDNESFTRHQAKIAGLRALNESRLASGLDALSPGPIDVGSNVAHYLAPGLNRIEVHSPRFDRAVMDAIEMFGKNAGELELVEGGPASLSIKEALRLAAISQSGAARLAWRSVETRPAVIAALDARAESIAKHRTATDAGIDTLASGGEVAT